MSLPEHPYTEFHQLWADLRTMPSHPASTAGRQMAVEVIPVRALEGLTDEQRRDVLEGLPFPGWEGADIIIPPARHSQRRLPACPPSRERYRPAAGCRRGCLVGFKWGCRLVVKRSLDTGEGWSFVSDNPHAHPSPKTRRCTFRDKRSGWGGRSK